MHACDWVGYLYVVVVVDRYLAAAAKSSTSKLEEEEEEEEQKKKTRWTDGWMEPKIKARIDNLKRSSSIFRLKAERNA